ncbi:MAG TPA: hypothetical protein VGN72_17325 [Tepidisphaeraceae bacterium]|nr:hypothetical protein [Tepidisphaeraceae bacterium]
MARTTDDGFIARLINVQGPCTTPLDAAIEYMRARIERIAPWYVLAMAPHAIVTVLLIDVIIAGQRSRIAPLCLWLLAATLWRWACLARLQQDVLRDLGQAGDVRLWSRLPAIICVRMASNVGITWGSIALGVPAFYGLFMGGFVAPLLLESRDPAVPRVRACMSWITHAGRRLLRVTLVMTLIILVGTIAAFVSQMVLANTVLSSLLGIDTADLNVTLGSWAWRLRVFYGLFLLFDVYWTVACVFLYYDSQSRRTATDLRVRLTDLTKAGA